MFEMFTVSERDSPEIGEDNSAEKDDTDKEENQNKSCLRNSDVLSAESTTAGSPVIQNAENLSDRMSDEQENGFDEIPYFPRIIPHPKTAYQNSNVQP